MVARVLYRAAVLPPVIVVCLVASMLITHGWAIDTTSQKSPADTESTSTKQPSATDAEAETTALALVDVYLPELKSVLAHLQSDRPREYERAIRDLARSARRLDAAKNRDDRLFDIEVETLQAQNDVTLLTARLKVRDSEKDRQRLQEAVTRLQRAQEVRSEYDVELYRQRLEKTQQLLDAAEQRLESRRDNAAAQLEKSYLALLRKAGREPKP